MEEYKYYMYYGNSRYKDLIDAEAHKKFNRYIMNIDNDALLAYTSDKKIAKIFESQRNMKLFTKKVEYLDKNLVNGLANEFQNNILTVKEFNFIDKETSFSKKVKIALTTFELMRYNNLVATVNLNLYKCAWTPPEIFLPEYIKALKTIGYVKLAKEVGSEMRDVFNNLVPLEVQPYVREQIDNAKLTDTVFKIDELSCVIRTIGLQL